MRMRLEKETYLTCKTRQTENKSQTHSISTNQPPNNFACREDHKHGDTCDFNIWLGLPIHPVTGRECPIFDYELDYYEQIKKHKHNICNKTTGGGITEITLRAALHACYAWELTGRQIGILNGTNMKEASVILNRLKEIISLKHPELIEKASNEILTLTNKRYFKVYPADHIDAIRSQPDLGFIFIDEAAFFEMQVANHIKIRNAVERYIPKTDPYILWVSTPNGPQGVFYEIWQEAHSSNNPFAYNPIEIDYLKAKEILIDTFIEKMKRDRPHTFDQEFGCKFLAPINAATPLQWIDRATKEYEI